MLILKIKEKGKTNYHHQKDGGLTTTEAEAFRVVKIEDSNWRQWLTPEFGPSIRIKKGSWAVLSRKQKIETVLKTMGEEFSYEINE